MFGAAEKGLVVSETLALLGIAVPAMQDGPKSVYYARQAIGFGRELDNQDAIFDMSILIGQGFWAKEQYDSARVYYTQAADALALIEARWDDPDRHDLEADQSRLWGTLGNFYAMQD